MSVSPSSSTLFAQFSGGGVQIPPVQMLLVQSLGAPHFLPLPHLAQSPPPQSTSVSLPFCMLSPQDASMHTFELEQYFGIWQVPHGMVPPQPFEIVPQFFPCSSQVVGVQPQTLAEPPPPQVCRPLQLLPQAIESPQPSEMEPQFSDPQVCVQGTRPRTSSSGSG